MISVCMATFNGEKYIRQQIDSILQELGSEDELVICDDGSTDGTVAVIESVGDGRIRLHRNTQRLRHVRNFEKALTLSRGDLIFLSDQDDVWLPGRTALLMQRASEDPHSLLVASNFDLIDAHGQRAGAFRNLLPKARPVLKQLALIFAGRSQYYGCSFLIKRELLEVALPIPGCIESHDIWLALVASSLDRVSNLMEPTLLHRLHGANVTAPRRRPLHRIIKPRLCFLFSLLARMTRYKLGRT